MGNVIKNFASSFILYLQGTAIFGAPPFISDDPVPVEYQHWQFYAFSTVDKSSLYQQVGAPSFTTNYGLIPNLEISLTLGLISWQQKALPFNNISARNIYGVTDSVLTPKYIILKESPNFPQVAFAPAISFPTGNQKQGLGNGYDVITYPIWLQKTWGSWVTYGGGGYLQNLAPGTKDFYFEGWVLQKILNEKTMLGVEVFNQNGNIITGRPYTLITLGGGYNFKPSASILLSLSHQIAGEHHLLGYIGLYFAT